MTIAEMIKKTRLDNNMTQGEYADKFGVTRQTVSSWENEKSIPDLQLIITICNTYNLSLDSLLNEDPKYVNKIDMTQKFVRILKRTLPLLCIIICIYISIFGIWKVTATKKNEDFSSTVTSLDFVLENGLYIMHDGDTTYELPNQKLPFMQFDFNLQQITATYRSESFSCNILLNYDVNQYIFNINYGLDKQITGSITNDNINYDNISVGNSIPLNEYKDTIETILKKMITYYNAVYNIDR